MSGCAEIMSGCAEMMSGCAEIMSECAEIIPTLSFELNTSKHLSPFNLQTLNDTHWVI